MTAKSEIEAIKKDESLSESERIWSAIDRLAVLVDDAPSTGARQAAEELNRRAQRFRV